MERWPVVNGLTALAGGGQAGATELRVQAINRVTTVATAADSTLLPYARKGSVCIVKNAAAANSMNVFPRVGQAVNALAADAAYAMAANKMALFACGVEGTWDASVTA